MKIIIAIPTYNGQELWGEVVNNIKKYAPSDVAVKVVDSGSVDNTVKYALDSGFTVEQISSSEFNHGGTRNYLVEKYIDTHDIVVFLTQDAIPQRNFIDEIVSVFEDMDVVCAYGRQMPHKNANPIAQHARFFNYTDTSFICDKESRESLGLKTVFMSNSFSAYRLSTFKTLGGFPSNTILCEDMFFTAKAILAGYKSAYVADAIVLHSHNYTPLQEFCRYFDIGVFHSDEFWIRSEFGGAGGEGKKFILSEIKYLVKKGYRWIPYACMNNFMKLLGYKIGLKYKLLPHSIVRTFSMHKRFWKSKDI
ncbi:TPA: glycosyltransferase family 2 protein [Klebsiella quasipneumoniae subsp. similipneumoniae]|nr:glycosyltransferase family 2 protein [Klebsiella quasipneumoniae subsp. similipneumoniae]